MFEALGVYRPMTLVPCDTNRTRVLSRSGHSKTGPFCFFCRSLRCPAKNLAPGSLPSDDCHLGGPGASPGLSCFVMTSERISSRAGNHRLDEPRQIIPPHGCVPGAPASVALFSYALRYFNEGTLSPFPAEAGHGWLIQTSVGTAACFGAWRTKRSG